MDAGEKRYIWRMGIVRFALPLFALTMGWTALDSHFVRSAQETPREMAITAAVSLVASALAGILYGRYLWEKEQRKRKEP